MLKNLKIDWPHWINILAIAGAAGFGKLAVNPNPSLAKDQAIFVIAATLLGAIATANISSKPDVGQGPG
jgi:hypothetical protein